MKTRAIILAGGEGTRLGVLTAKRTKPAVPFGGKYRIIDFPLSNCVNSSIFDVMIIAQYRPHSLIEHIGAGGPWDLNRDFTGGVRIYTPYKARLSDWFIGTADAVQQNFSFIKRGEPDLILILSGDHVYSMNYESLIKHHLENHAELTMATIEVPFEEASRFGVVDVDQNYRVTSFVEKPQKPLSNLANMGIYLFNRHLLDKALWDDHMQKGSSHDFGKDVIPNLMRKGVSVISYPYEGYWVDVGTINSYWQAHMDLLQNPPPLDLNNRNWVIHTRTEERPPIKIHRGAVIEDSLICDGAIIETGAKVTRSILSPGVVVHSGSVINESIILTDTVIGQDVVLQRSVLDKRCLIENQAQIGDYSITEFNIAMVGKNSVVPQKMIIQGGASIGTDVATDDYTGQLIANGEHIQTRRLPHEI